MSVTSELTTYIPEASAAAGYVIGQGMEQVARFNIARQRASALPSHANLAIKNRQPIWRRGLAQLAVIGAVAGFAAGEAVRPNVVKHETDPLLEMVVDHSFVTGQDGSLSRINIFSEEFTSDSQLRVQAIVSHNGNFDFIKPVSITDDQPYGPPSLDDALPVAMGAAYDKSAPAQSNIPGTGESHSAAVLVVTDGNPVGDVETLVNQAREDGNLPIFVANMDGNDDPIANQLRSVASETHGRYWDIKTNVAETAEAIKRDILPPAKAEATNGNNTDRLALAIIAGALAAAMALQFVKRKNESFIAS